MNSNFNEKPKGNDVDVDVHRPGRACGMRMAKGKDKRKMKRWLLILAKFNPNRGLLFAFLGVD